MQTEKGTGKKTLLHRLKQRTVLRNALTAFDGASFGVAVRGPRRMRFWKGIGPALALVCGPSWSHSSLPIIRMAPNIVIAPALLT